MLHLAQVEKQLLVGKIGLRLLAREEAPYTWAVMAEEVVIPMEGALLGANVGIALSEGLLVLVELSPTRKIKNIQSATSWVLELVQTYLTSGITPLILQQEAERAEKWRQSLTLQNQELASRSLELEARLEKIQALEESLRRYQEGGN